MSRYINEPITVHISRESIPTAFIWRKRLYQIRAILSWWREPSDWWDGQPVRMIIRVAAESKRQGIYELCKANADWSLYKLLD